MNSEFTYKYYQHMLQTLRDAGYRFCSFTEGKVDARNGQDMGLVILRHDIDHDPFAAKATSMLESSMGITATYFFMVSCPLYNIFEGETRKLIEGLHASGFDIGLHFNYPAYKARHSSVVRTEAGLLKQIVPISAVSLHKPDMEVAKTLKLHWPHTYEPVFINGGFEYFSDSGGTWSRGNPIESEEFKQGRNLHILVHPIWWGGDEMNPREKLWALKGRIGERATEYFESNCPRAWGSR